MASRRTGTKKSTLNRSWEEIADLTGRSAKDCQNRWHHHLKSTWSPPAATGAAAGAAYAAGAGQAAKAATGAACSPAPRPALKMILSSAASQPRLPAPNALGFISKPNSGNKEWYCVACTFLNPKGLALACEVCSTTRSLL
jgi:hypothetical protein